MKLLLLSITVVICCSVFAQSPKSPRNLALRFNGKTDLIHFGDIYKDVKLPFTISAWANLDTTNFWYAPIFTNRNCLHEYAGFRLIIDRNLISLEYGDGYGSNHPAYRSGKFANVTLAPGKWYHVTAVVVDADNIELYLNGVNVGGELNGASRYPMDSNKEGYASAGYFTSNHVEYWFKGMIDDIRFWSRALSISEVSENMCKPLKGTEEGLIGYWDFNEPEGSLVLDKSRYKFHGKMKGNPARVVSGLPCTRPPAIDH